MKRFALIGHPVAGSLSPRLFQAAYGGRYPYDLIDEAAFADAWERFLAQYEGINVTAPFKQDAYASVDRLSPEASLTGAVNLVVRREGELVGYNTDVEGVLGAVREAGLPVSDALVVGAGGAARAAAVAARQLGCRVTITNRTLAKAEALAAALGCEAVSPADAGALAPDLVVYTIPGGENRSAESVISGLSGELLRGAVVLEAEYKHPVLSSVPCRAYLGGRRWLLWQAVAGYGLFTGELPDVEKMSAVL
jgi:shikimate dehydrogenase